MLIYNRGEGTEKQNKIVMKMESMRREVEERYIEGVEEREEGEKGRESCRGTKCTENVK